MQLGKYEGLYDDERNGSDAEADQQNSFEHHMSLIINTAQNDERRAEHAEKHDGKPCSPER
ncbi:hypothetical protein D1872_288520 [compost metagenome]